MINQYLLNANSPTRRWSTLQNGSSTHNILLREKKLTFFIFAAETTK